MWAFTPVQDRHAAPAICRALADLAAVAEVQVAIIARGGGSQADLLALSDETLCRTVAMCPIPVIASVGHHTDRTLLDDVAAVSCSTPTHAAEAAVGIDCGRARLETLAAAVRLRDHGRRAVLSRARTLAMLSRAPAGGSSASERCCTSGCANCAPAPGGAWASEQALAHRRARGARAQGLLDAARLPPAAPRELEQLALALAGHDPQRTLERGYALAFSPAGEPLTGAAAARAAGRAATALRRRRAGRRRARAMTEQDAQSRAAVAAQGRLSYEAASCAGSRRSSGGWTPARRASTRRSRC